MGAIANTAFTLSAAVANGGALTVPYPSGTTQASLAGSIGGGVAIDNADRWPQAASGAGTVNFAFGASNITVTNNSGVAWNAGQNFKASFGRTDRNGGYNLVIGTTADTAKAGNL